MSSAEFSTARDAGEPGAKASNRTRRTFDRDISVHNWVDGVTRLARREPRSGALIQAIPFAGVAGVGAALPAQTVSNAPIARRLGVDEQWIVKRTGVHERRMASPQEGLTDLAVRAGGAALERAGLDATELDLILVASFTQDELLPNAAPLVAARVGAVSAGAMDIGAASSGFLSALMVGTAQIESSRADAVLVIGAELMSRVTDPSDRGTAALFGDGAGAAVLTAGGPGRIGPILLRSDAAGADCIRADLVERRVRMRGLETFEAAVARLTESTIEACAAAEVKLDDIDVFIFHQGNARITRAVGARLGVAEERVVSCIARYGNTSAASIPIALAEAVSGGRLQRGSLVLLAAFAAGFIWGAGIVEW